MLVVSFKIMRRAAAGLAVIRELLSLTLSGCSLPSRIPWVVIEPESRNYLGLYWDYAFQKDPESGKQECTKDMLDILVPGLRKTKEFTRLLTDPNRKVRLFAPRPFN